MLLRQLGPRLSRCKLQEPFLVPGEVPWTTAVSWHPRLRPCSSAGNAHAAKFSHRWPSYVSNQLSTEGYTVGRLKRPCRTLAPLYLLAQYSRQFVFSVLSCIGFAEVIAHALTAVCCSFCACVAVCLGLRRGWASVPATHCFLASGPRVRVVVCVDVLPHPPVDPRILRVCPCQFRVSPCGRSCDQL